MTLTIHILIKNNEQTIDKCLKSLVPLNIKPHIIDIGSTDRTSEICKNYQIYPVKRVGDDLSKIRNQIVEEYPENWQFYLEPYEELALGHAEIKEIIKSKEQAAFYFKIAQKQIITKEIRLWKGPQRFIYPVYETIQYEPSLEIKQGLILCDHAHIDVSFKTELVKQWKANKPFDTKPHYYEALNALFKRDYKNFLNATNFYLFKDKKSMASVMLRYYLASIQAYELEEFDNAIHNTCICLYQKPTMAEFWCLLGDIFYLIHQYDKSAAFYENAILIGKKRLKSDKWPIDLAKYNEHPIKMIKQLEESKQNIKIYKQVM